MTLSNMQKELASVFLIKLVTGDTLLSEVVFGNETDGVTHLIYPIQIDQDIKNQRFSFSEWVLPFLDKPTVDIADEDIIIMEPVSNNYVKVYGSFVSHIIVNSIKLDVMNNSSESSEYYDIQGAVEKIKEVSKEMKRKFDIPEIDLSEFEEETKKFKPPLMH